MPARIAVITGPTATGKTELGILLAQIFNGEIVSADSMQVYRRMDVGTAKPTPDQRRAAAHHMIDISDPDEPFSVARWTDMARACTDDILRRGKLPVIVGGTGLYIDSLISGRSFAAAPDGGGELRRELARRYDEQGGHALLGELSGFDPSRAAKLHPSDKKRIIRAIEVFRLTGKTITEHDEQTRRLPPRYDATVIALNFARRESLYARIDARVDAMVSAGLFEEVSALLRSGLPDSCTAMQAIGYKEAVMALRGLVSKDEAVSAIKQDSRRYAKRQLTWLRRDEAARWLIWDKEPDFDYGICFSTEIFKAGGIE